MMFSHNFQSRLASLAILTAFLFHKSAFAQTSPTTLKGCFSSSTGLLDQGSYKFQSTGYCQKLCIGINKPVMALTGGSNCLCGDLLPPEDSKVEDSDCSSKCQGYGQQTCGGDGKYGVFLTGTESDVGSAVGIKQPSDNDKPVDNPPPSNNQQVGDNKQVDSPPPDTTSAPVQSEVVTVKPSVVTVGGSTIVSTLPGTTYVVGASDSSPQRETAAPAPSQSASSDDDSGSTGSKVGIAVGIVVGVLALAAIIGGGFFFWKRRQNVNAPSRHRHSTSVGAFAGSGSHPAGASVGSFNSPAAGAPGSSSDNRLDPTMVERRQSDGSVFEDSEDYSRRILKVTNPSG